MNPSAPRPAPPLSELSPVSAMTRRSFVALPLLLAAHRGLAAATVNWPSFRGPLASGGGDASPLPTEWKVKWESPLEGLGHSSPVVWGDRPFVATAVTPGGKAPIKLGLYGDRTAADETTEQLWKIMCFDKRTGRALWEQTAHQAVPRTQRHMKATQANTTIATDGKVLVACFGSEGLHCYNLDGERRWKKDLGVVNVSKYGVGWGYASSPTLHGDRIILQCDAPDNPYLAAFRLSDGEEIWRTSRKGVCERCWSTPYVHAEGARTQVVALRACGGRAHAGRRQRLALRGGLRLHHRRGTLAAENRRRQPDPHAVLGARFDLRGERPRRLCAGVGDPPGRGRRHHSGGRRKREPVHRVVGPKERHLHPDSARLPRSPLLRLERRYPSPENSYANERMGMIRA